MRSIINLHRLISTDEGTFGIIVFENNCLFTLELPNRDNKPNISCIPTGTYDVSLKYSPHFHKQLYHLHDVPNRSYIMIHPANFGGNIDNHYQSQLSGCIALGKGIGKIINIFGKKQEAILNSRLAIKEFYDIMRGRNFKLKVSDGFFY